ncbi:MAG: flavin reductase family protein, partial [Oscillospiraceae bacterium]
MSTSNISEIQNGLSPNQFCLLTSMGDDSKTNIMALSWWTFVSNSPARLAVSINSHSCSGENIKKNKEFALCMVREGMKEKALECGKLSGKTINKSDKLGIKLIDAKAIGPRVIADSSMILECRLVNICSVGDHDIFIADIAESYITSDQKHLFAFEGYS